MITPMITPRITLQVFEDGLDLYGGALERWPAEARRDAEALLTQSAEARAAQADALAVDAALAMPAFDSPAFDVTGIDGAAGRFAAVATRHAQDRPILASRRTPMLRRAGWGAAVAAALVLGLLVGNVEAGGHDEGPDQVLASALGVTAGTVDVD